MEDHLSIAEAAAELQMTEAAVLRACLDEQLELSIRFSGRNLPYAKLRRQVPMEIGYPPRRVKTAELGLYDMTMTLGSDRSLWTLAMAGSGRLCVEDEYQKAIGRTPAVSDSSPSSRLGVFVLTPDISVPEPGHVLLCELVEYRGTAPASGIRFDEDFHSMRTLPTGAELVVSEKALSAFKAKRSNGTDVVREEKETVGSVSLSYVEHNDPAAADPSRTAQMSESAVTAFRDWMSQAREIALDYIDRHVSKDLYPTQDDVASHAESECRRRGVFGPRGPLSAATIKRDAIQGDWWSENKPANRLGKVGKPGQPN
jgi:hypothetical protein